MERKPLKTKKVTISISKPTSSSWADILTYLARVIDPKEIPNYTLLIGLASYARSNNGLTEKQERIADDICDYAKERGIL